MSNRPSCVNLKRMKFNNPNPSSEECATGGLLLMAAGRCMQAKETVYTINKNREN
jgi:hypothetical protein